MKTPQFTKKRATRVTIPAEKGVAVPCGASVLGCGGCRYGTFSPRTVQARVVHRQCVESGREIRAQRTGLRTGRGTGASGWQYVDVAECERNALQREFHGGKPVAYILGDTGESPDAHRIFDAAGVYLFPKEFVIWGVEGRRHVARIEMEQQGIPSAWIRT